MQKRILKKVGRGWFTKPMHIVKMRSKSSLQGKVLKKYQGTFTRAGALRIERMVLDYLSFLKQTGIPTLETKVKLIPTKNNKYRLFMLQPLIEKQNILSEKLKVCSREEALDYFRQTLNYVNQLSKFNSRGAEKVGLDLKPKNYAIVNGKVTQLDFFPPQIKENMQVNSRDLTEHLGSRMLRGMTRLVGFPVDNRIEHALEQHFSPDFLSDRISRHFTRVRPELKKEFDKVLAQTKDL